MFKPLIILTVALAAGLALSPAFAGGSDQHSAQAIGHSGQASSQGSAAVASGAALVTAVPILIVGAGITISGAALAEVGEGALATGSALAHAAAQHPQKPKHIAPDGAPTLD